MEQSEISYDKLFVPIDGVYLEPLNPEPGKMSIEAIAQGLSTEFRYGGQTDPLVTVAQHATDTSRILEAEGYDPLMQFYGLHHDSSEAYLGDTQKPNKEVLSSLDELEDIWQDSVWEYLDVDSPSEEQEATVKDVDLNQYLHEVDELFIEPEHRREALEIIDRSELGDQELVEEMVDLGMSIDEAKKSFIDRHEELVTKI